MSTQRMLNSLSIYTHLHPFFVLLICDIYFTAQFVLLLNLTYVLHLLTQAVFD